MRPGLDDKVLTEWNAMFCSALAEAASATGRSDWAERAVAVAEFLWRELRRPEDGRWLRSWQSAGGARHLAYAADYAWLVDCFTRLGELTGAAVWTERAVDAADGLFDLFHDDADGGFFTTGRDAEALIVRTKDVFDGAIPAANSVAALSLARLSALTDSNRYRSGAAEIIDLLGDLLSSHPTAFATTVLAAELLARGTTEIVVVGDRPDLVELVQRRGSPKPFSPGVSPPLRRCGRAVRPGKPTSATTTPVSCPPLTRMPWRPSSTGDSGEPRRSAPSVEEGPTRDPSREHSGGGRSVRGRSVRGRSVRGRSVRGR